MAGPSRSPDTRPLPVVHHADLDEHPLDTGSVDAVAMYASDAKDELNPCCPFAETVLRPGSVLLLRCEVGAEEEIHQRVTEEYDNGTPTLAMVHGGHWWPVLVFVRQGDEAHLAERTAYVGDDEQACWRAIFADWTHPADGLVCDLCADDGRILAAADAAQRRAVGLCRDEAQVERVRAEGRTRQGRTAGIDGKVGWPGGGRASGRSAAATRGEDKPHVRVALGAPALPPGGRWIATPVDRRGCSHSAKSPGPPRLRSLLSPPVRVLSRSDRGGPSRSRRVAGHRVGRLLGSPVRTGPGPSRLRAPDVGPVSEPAVSVVADPELGGVCGQPLSASALDGEPSPATRPSRSSGSRPSQRAQDRSNRIVSVVAFDAQNLLAQEDLIDFGALEHPARAECNGPRQLSAVLAGHSASSGKAWCSMWTSS